MMWYGWMFVGLVVGFLLGFCLAVYAFEQALKDEKYRRFNKDNADDGIELDPY